MPLERGGDFVHGQAHDIGHGSGDALDDEVSVLLRGIGSGLVERVHFRVVGGHLFPGEWFENHLGRDGERVNRFCFALVMDEGDGGKNLMGLPVQLGEHAGRLLAVGGLSKDLLPEQDKGVGRYRDRSGIGRGDGVGLEPGIEGGELADGDGGIFDLDDVGFDDGE